MNQEVEKRAERLLKLLKKINENGGEECRTGKLLIS